MIDLIQTALIALVGVGVLILLLDDRNGAKR